MFCEHCGAKLEDDALFCSECGNIVEKTSNQDPIIEVPEEKNVALGEEPNATLGTQAKTSETMQNAELGTVLDTPKSTDTFETETKKSKQKTKKKEKQVKENKAIDKKRIIITVILVMLVICTAIGYIYSSHLKDNNYNKFSNNWEEVITESASADTTTEGTTSIETSVVEVTETITETTNE